MEYSLYRRHAVVTYMQLLASTWTFSSRFACRQPPMCPARPAWHQESQKNDVALRANGCTRLR